MKALLYAAGTALLALSAVAAETAKPQDVQMAKQFQFRQTKTAQVNYLLFLPKAYKQGSGEKFPLILFLHGAGERGSDVWKVATHGPPKNVTSHPDFPFIVVSPQCPEDQIWSNDVLLGLLDEIEAKYAVDTNRVYLTGLSMGGYGTWDLGLAYPERFAAIVPICGGGEFITVLLSTPEKTAALRTLGIWAFHGGKDPVVPVDESKRMVALMKRIGAREAKLTIYPEAQHDAWTETYNNPELYTWLLMHHRGGTTSVVDPTR